MDSHVRPSECILAALSDDGFVIDPSALPQRWDAVIDGAREVQRVRRVSHRDGWKYVYRVGDRYFFAR